VKTRLAAAAGLLLIAAVARRVSRQARSSAFRDKVVLVSGGARGLGLQLAREAAARGARLALLARSEIELRAASDELRAGGTIVETAVCDVRSDADVAATVARFEASLGPVDILCNVAGVIEVGPVDALTVDDYRDAIETNYLGAVRLVEAVRPAMQARRGGQIVNITSLGGRIPVPHLLPYSASKFAILGYSEGLHAELARFGIAVTTVVPGLMRTGSPPQATFAGRPESEYAMFAPSDSLPLLSVSAAYAARLIADGAERRAAEVIVSWQARLAILAYRLVPRLVVALMTTAARVLPDSGGSREHRYGHESESPLTRSPLDALGHAATRTQNEDLDLRATSP
jgi:short-subunit dehydrogenase